MSVDIQLVEGRWKVYAKDGEAVTYTPAEIHQQWPLYSAAAERFAQEFCPDSEMECLGVAVHTLTKQQMNEKRFLVYTKLADIAGWTKRRKLPSYLEGAIKAQWSTPGEQFTGFKKR